MLWGRAFPVETGVPYAIFADAFSPFFGISKPQTLTVLSRGGERELAYLFPALAKGKPPPTPASGVEPGEFKTRLLWNFNELLGNLAGRNPLLLILEDLQWADDSSLELLHFIARQSDAQHLVVIATYNETERDRNPRLPTTERSLGIHRRCHRQETPDSEPRPTPLSSWSARSTSMRMSSANFAHSSSAGRAEIRSSSKRS